MVGEVIDKPVEGCDHNIVMTVLHRDDSLVVVHSISRVDAENIPASLRSGPIEIPIIVSGHLQPSTLLKVVKQN